MKLRKFSVIAMGAMLALSACGGTSSGSVNKNVQIAVELPFQGSDKAASDPILNGIRLAVKQAGGKVGDFTVTVPNSAVYDDALNGAHDPQTGANNMTKIVGNPAYIAVVGPVNSSVAKAQIPISSAAGLLQCSPSNTNTALTIGPDAAALRGGHPNNYIRVVTNDAIQGPAAAAYIITVLKKTNVYIIDDTETFGKGIADSFEKEFIARGGKVVKHDGVPKTTQDYVSIMTTAKALNPDSIYFGGVTASGGARIALAAAQVGLDVPFVGPDGINDGSGETKDSFLNLANSVAKNAYSTLAGPGTFEGKAKFDADYKAEYGIDATGYAGQGYACTQVVLDALARAAATNPKTDAALREAVRVAGTDTSHEYTLDVGKVKFDANGDTSQLIVSIYSFDPAAANGKGDWKYETQVDAAAK